MYERTDGTRRIGLPPVLGWILVAVLGLAGCGPAASTPAASGPAPPVAATYALSGTVTESGTGRTLPGAVLTLTGAGTAMATTDAAGAYHFADRAIGRYTLSAALSGYVFNPPSTTILIGNQDLTYNFLGFGTQTTGFAISGTVSLIGSNGTKTPLQVAVTAVNGPTSTTVSADAFGAYTIAGLPNGLYSVFIPAITTCTSGCFVQTVNLANGDVTGVDFNIAL